MNNTPSVRVGVLMMFFPAPSETFAARDIRAWIGQGVEVSLHCMRGRQQLHDRLVADYEVAAVPVNHPTVGGRMRALIRACARPGRFAALLRHVFGARPRSAVSVLKSILLLPAAFEIAARLQREKVDVVHLYWGHYPSLVGLIVREYGLPMKLSMFLGAYDLDARLGISRRCAALADLLWTHAEANLDAIEQLGIDSQRFVVNRRAVDIEEVDRYQGTGERDRDIDLLTAARLAPGKGVDRVIEALPVLAAQGFKPRFIVVGDGAERSRLQRLAAARDVAGQVEFRGYLPLGETLELMRRARVFVLLSDAVGERLPNVVKEALLLGCYCVVGRSQGIDELVADPKIGVVVDHWQPELVASVLAECIASRVVADQNAARKLIHERFDSRKSAALYIAHWRRLIEG